MHGGVEGEARTLRFRNARYPNHCERLDEIGINTQGGFAKYIVLPARTLWSLEPLADRYAEEDLFVAGSLVEPTSVAYTAVIERNRSWKGAFETEPYEAAWAGEAIFYVRALEANDVPEGTPARVQISPDGMRWCDEGTSFPLPTGTSRQETHRA